MNTVDPLPPAELVKPPARPSAVVPEAPGQPWYSLAGLWRRKTTVIASLSVAAILCHLALRFGWRAAPGISRIPLLVTLVIGGLPLV